MNAAAALVAAGKADHLPAAIPLAEKSIDSGAAANKLEALVRFTKTHS
jgi:anthranilate phosphoribosyltransferase